MAIHCYDEGNSLIQAYIVDGFLPSRSALIQTTEEINDNCPDNRKSHLANLAISWDDWNEDDIFERMAYNVRVMFCGNRPKNKSGYIWSEAWLLKPKRWEDAFELTDEQADQSRRRLLITLYQGCKYGKECLTNLVKISGIQVIPDDKYRNRQAFKDTAEHFLEDIALPFKAPCMIAEERIASKGYEYRDFGS